MQTPLISNAGRMMTGDWAKRNPEKMREYNRAWRAKNLEKERERSRLSKAKYRGKSAQYERDRRKTDEYKVVYSKWYKGYMEKNRDLILEKRRIYRTQKRAEHHLKSVSHNARRRGIECDLDERWFQERLDYGLCEMSGLPFDMEGKRTDNCPSVDRINPKGPYTKDNCRMILWWLNRAMADRGEEYCVKVFTSVIERKSGKCQT